jgi:hypothetical protein
LKISRAGSNTNNYTIFDTYLQEPPAYARVWKPLNTQVEIALDYDQATVANSINHRSVWPHRSRLRPGNAIVLAQLNVDAFALDSCAPIIPAYNPWGISGHAMRQKSEML